MENNSEETKLIKPVQVVIQPGDLMGINQMMDLALKGGGNSMLDPVFNLRKAIQEGLNLQKDDSTGAV